jgi:hypothetical protein
MLNTSKAAPESLPPLVSHLESHLGVMSGGSRMGELPDIQISLFQNQPAPGAITYCTLGLSHHLLRGATDRMFRFELLGVAAGEFKALQPEARLFDVAEQILSTHRAPLRGEIFGPGGPIVTGATVEALYCTMPFHFPDALATFEGTDPPTVFIYLVPTTRSEARFAQEHGWDAFEELLEKNQPDLLDLCRSSII